MDIESLPPYRGLPDSLRTWGEPDEQGCLPTMRLRDWGVACALLAIGAPILLQVVFNSWIERQRIGELDAARRRQLELEILQDLHDRKRIAE